MPNRKRKPLFSLAIACRIALNLQALNNEGTENNRLIPRQVSLVVPTRDPDGQPHYIVEEVHAISGDMLKHIFMDYLRLIALDRGLPLCDACRALHPGRMLGNAEFTRQLADQNNPTFWDTTDKGQRLNGARVTDQLLTCVLDDLGGTLIPVGDGVRRESPLDFGWIAGVPELTHTRQYIHTRHAANLAARKPDGNDADSEQPQINSGQMLFERTASSGVYALLAHLSVYDIGYNRYARDYPAEVNGIPLDRAARLEATLLALTETLRYPKGALTSTQMPHPVNLEGYLSLSTTAAIAAPMISPLHVDYIAATQALLGPLERLHGKDKVSIHLFHSEAELLALTADILNTYAPARLVR
ncbi:MAG: hypothetical protein K8J31_09715 [Anaerolineae bacterium]|nr:hypothetical protein [Anaerolineae bacterium]